MKSIHLSVVLLTVSWVGAIAESKDYRKHLTSIDGFDWWFRIGSYTLEHHGERLPVDLYYSDSDQRPDGKDVQIRSYPNSFGLYCVWRKSSGEWTHKEIAGSARVAFHRIVAAKKESIELELRPKFMITVKPGEDAVTRWKRAEEINRPFIRILTFKDGEPILGDPIPTEAEQGGVGQPATAPELKPEGKEKT